MGLVAGVGEGPDDYEVVTLPPHVVSATRTPQDPRHVPGSVSLLQPVELGQAQTELLSNALGTVPGITVVSTGGAGGQVSVFIRGASSHHTLFVVDGVRMNDRSAAYQNFLGGADLSGLDRVEVLRGPQSTLYGSAALGGVILLDTAYGCGSPSGIFSASVGSFESRGGAFAAQGGAGGVGWSFSGLSCSTENDLPDNDYRLSAASTRLEMKVSESLLAGATLRLQRSEEQSPGSRLWPAPADVTATNLLATIYAHWKPLEDLSSRLTLAIHRREYGYFPRYPYGMPDEQWDLRHVIDWQTTWAPCRGLEMVAGASLEHARHMVNGGRSTENLRAGFLSATARPCDTLTLTTGIRRDDMESVAGATTWRGGLAWQMPTWTRLRANYGTGFCAPGAADRHGVPAWGQLPSPGLQPERSRGWDAGVDQELFSGALVLAATWFENRFRNLFDWETVNWMTYEGRIINRSRASSSGLELAVEAKPVEPVRLRLSYTHLEAEDDTSGARLARRPRHALDGDVRVQATARWIIGAGVHMVEDRVEPWMTAMDYTTVRVFTSYAARPDLILKLRVENALDRQYEDVPGYPSLPRGVYGGVDWRY